MYSLYTHVASWLLKICVTWKNPIIVLTCLNMSIEEIYK